MARIVVQPLHSDGEPRRWTLSERIITENLDSDHYLTQLVERLRWATADAEALESQPADLVSDNDGKTLSLEPLIGSAGTALPRQRDRPSSSRRVMPSSPMQSRV